MGSRSLVKIKSVTAELLLVCTNVARTYVAWTNVIMAVGMVKGTYLKSFVYIVSVTAEIFLIWTNVTRTNVASTNVPLNDVPRNLSF